VQQLLDRQVDIITAQQQQSAQLQELRRDGDERDQEIHRLRLEIHRAKKQQEADDAKLFRLAYSYSCKKFTNFGCLVCKKMDARQMMVAYLDITNEGFHCRDHRQAFHMAVRQTWGCCDLLDPQDK